MTKVLAKVLRALRMRQGDRARELRARTDQIRKDLSRHGGRWDSTAVIRAIRDGR